MDNVTIRNIALLATGFILPFIFIGCGEDPASKSVGACDSEENRQWIGEEAHSAISRIVSGWDYSDIEEVRLKDVVEHGNSTETHKTCEATFVIDVGSGTREVKGGYDFYRAEDGSVAGELDSNFVTNVDDKFNW